MAEQTPQRLNLNAMDFANDDVTEEGTKAIRYLTSRLQEAQSNPKASCKHKLSFYEQMQAQSSLSHKFHKKELALWNEGSRQEEKVPMKIKGLLLRGEEDLMQGKLLGHKEEEHHNDANSGSATHGQSNDDLPPRRRRPQRSPNRSLRRRRRSPSYSSSSSSEDKYKRRHPRHKRRRSPTPPSSSPNSSSTATSSRSKPKRRGHRRSHPAWKRSRRYGKIQRRRQKYHFPLL